MRINSTTPSLSVDITTPRVTTLSSSQSTSTATNTISSSDEPELNAYNDYTSDFEALRTEVTNEYYSQQVAIDKTFDNPAQHIYDKYKNENSEYFRSDLTERGRLAAYRNEMSYLESGYTLYSDYNIYELIGNMNYTDEAALKKEFNREQINEQFAQLLEDNNITIPANTKLSFTVDPYTTKVTVSGTDDTQLINSIEAVMDEENGEQLFRHIKSSEWGTNTQFSSEKELKQSIFGDIKYQTGYNLNELEVVDGKFVTEDGTDIALLFKEAINNSEDIKEDWIKPFIVGDMYDKLADLAEKGFENVPDLVLSIDFENGSFHDVGQSKGFGTGETEWIFNKAESLQRDKISKQIKEMIKEEKAIVEENKKLTFTINSDANKVEVSGGDDKINSLLEAFLNEENAKGLFLYIILEQWDEETPMTYDLLKELLENSFKLMNGESISLEYENGSLLELPKNTTKIDWLDRLLANSEPVNIYA